MKKIALALALGLAVALLVATGASPAVAHHQNYYGDSSKAVAKHIGCKRFSEGAGRGAFNKDSGVCWLKGKRVNVITFRGPAQQREWNSTGRVLLPSRTW